ncbi:hypothetical protein B0A52_08171 [Exophiala mesophila]|uniref:GH16 domain-containing protein n=1 Tax=Exophiala mesophila TaxID=212818 RepID=A0A438MV59_EXOME|nr:hypothetical protein B0A52_08171 [Exophiala mesophila]
MKEAAALYVLGTCVLLAQGSPQNYKLVKNYTVFPTNPDNANEYFFDGFDLHSGSDAANGFVNYQDMRSALDNQLTGVFDYIYQYDDNTTKEATDLLYLGVDSRNFTPTGRPSLRLESKETFNQGLFVADIYHMPGGCGVWPAFWMLGTDGPWPDAGEIDILEGINDQTQNRLSLHTSKTLTLDNHTSPSNISFKLAGGIQNGVALTTDCNVVTSGGRGCSISSVLPEEAFGSEFNRQLGSFMVVEYTSGWIKAWQMDRALGEQIFGQNSSGYINADAQISWGTPTAVFSRNGTNLEPYFRDLRIILNTDFCGPWINGGWTTSSCASLAPTCSEYVEKNPEAFEQAFWLVKSVQIYETDSVSIDDRINDSMYRYAGRHMHRQVGAHHHRNHARDFGRRLSG